MSLYLQIDVGVIAFLLDTASVIEVRRDNANETGSVAWQGESVPRVDLRELFAEPADAAPGCCIIVRQSDGRPAALLADHSPALLELTDDQLSPLPSIGRFGELIDAVSTIADANHPALRLRGEHILAASNAVTE